MFAKLYTHIWAVSETLHFDTSRVQIPVHSFNSHQNTLWTCFTDFKIPCERVDWDRDPPPKKSQEGWLSYGILLQKSEMFVFPDSGRNFNLRCHAGCYSSSSWLKQIAPVGRSNHRVTHGTLVHYDLGIRVPWRKKSKKSVKLMVWMFSRCQQVKVSLRCASKVGRYLLLVVFNQVSKIKEKTKTYFDLLC